VSAVSNAPGALENELNRSFLCPSERNLRLLDKGLGGYIEGMVSVRFYFYDFELPPQTGAGVASA
jgi:hypothetical protein